MGDSELFELKYSTGNWIETTTEFFGCVYRDARIMAIDDFSGVYCVKWYYKGSQNGDIHFIDSDVLERHTRLK
jgi:hypothetical protein